MNTPRQAEHSEHQNGIGTRASILTNGVSTLTAIALAAGVSLATTKQSEAQSQAACVFTGPAILPCAAVTTTGTLIVSTISGLTILMDRISRGEVMLAPRSYHSGVYACRGTIKKIRVKAHSITRACAQTPPEIYECGADQGYSTRYFTCEGGGIPGPEDYLPGY